MRVKFVYLMFVFLPMPLCAQIEYTGYAINLPPLHPTEVTQCDAYRSKYDDQLVRITDEHQNCLDRHVLDKDHRQGSDQVCTSPACQWIHSQWMRAKQDGARVREDASLCEGEVQRYKDQLQRQKEQAAQLLAEQQQEQQDAAARLQQQQEQRDAVANSQKQNQAAPSKNPNPVIFSKTSIDARNNIHAIELLAGITQTLLVLKPAIDVVSVDNPVDAVVEAHDVFSFSTEDWKAYADFIRDLSVGNRDAIHAIALATLAELRHKPKGQRNEAEENYWGQMIEELEK